MGDVAKGWNLEFGVKDCGSVENHKWNINIIKSLESMAWFCLFIWVQVQQSGQFSILPHVQDNILILHFVKNRTRSVLKPIDLQSQTIYVHKNSLKKLYMFQTMVQVGIRTSDDIEQVIVKK